jgi:hypothetical protein
MRLIILLTVLRPIPHITRGNSSGEFTEALTVLECVYYASKVDGRVEAVGLRAGIREDTPLIQLFHDFHGLCR